MADKICTYQPKNLYIWCRTFGKKNIRTMCNMLAGELLLLQNAFKTDAKYRATHNPWVATGAALDGNCQCTRKANNHQSKCLLKS